MDYDSIPIFNMARNLATIMREDSEVGLSIFDWDIELGEGVYDGDEVGEVLRDTSKAITQLVRLMKT